ncbi:hypothetical protein SETIT_9G069400v2 [Setaria italica]|uniref:Uncharacterized protein n=1 Tax=Setaria italica TaxID=4555 RepID=K4ABF9_SETIT|nr:uncharacterized protein LOC101783891 [Setaria italica]RCV40617.1 hypothetical protein SETIT_9G069400v2 [Setaria italica]
MDPEREPLAGGGLQRRPGAAARAGGGPQEPPPRGRSAIHADVDPQPRPWPWMQKVAIVAIVVLGCLQFLPATHFRDPSDPHRNWIPVGGSRNPTDSLDVVGSVDVFSWISCLDLRTLAALTNSTLSSSSDPQNISFHFLIPEGDDDKVPYHTLKVVLPDSDLTVSSQRQIKDKLNVATPEGNFLWSFHKELSPLLIAKSQLSKKRYLYISADSIIKGKIEDLGRMDLGTYAIAATEDCSKHFGDYVNMDVLSDTQRAAAKSWVSKEDTCLLDFDVLLVEPRKLDKNLVDSIMSWTRVVTVANPRDRIRLAVALALYGKYLKLPSIWKRGDANADILNYDGPHKVCSEDGHQHEQSSDGENWRKYLHQKFEAILNA